MSIFELNFQKKLVYFKTIQFIITFVGNENITKKYVSVSKRKFEFQNLYKNIQFISDIINSGNFAIL